jgi:hypothetical protein
MSQHLFGRHIDRNYSANRPSHRGPNVEVRMARDEEEAAIALRHIKHRARREKQSNRKRPPITLAKINF